MATASFRRHFRRRKALHFQSAPLPPLLAETKRGAGAFREGHLSSVARRMQEAADMIAFLLAWSVNDALELDCRITSASIETRYFIDANLYRFDRTAFDALRVELLDLERQHLKQSAYPNHVCTKKMHSV